MHLCEKIVKSFHFVTMLFLFQSQTMISGSAFWAEVIEDLSSNSREEKNELLPIILSRVEIAQEWYTEFFAGESRHIELVRRVMRSLGYVDCRHDYTKDTYYLFILCGRYGQANATSNPVFEGEFRREVARHLSLEAHHPEYELAGELECSDADIEEMAVDRLARSIQMNSGTVNLKEMELFRPTFHRGDVDHKLRRYSSMVAKHGSLVTEEYMKVFSGLTVVQTQSAFNSLPVRI